MLDQQKSYRQIMKATSIFGGVQVINIIIGILKSKFIAVFLGPAGMGIAGLLTSTLGLIGGLTNFGLGTSAVKNISTANSTGNETRIAIVIIVLRRLVWITGAFGTIVTIVLSPLLSQLTFGNHEYTTAFIWISLSLLFAQLTSGQMVILQGLRKLQLMAKANVFGSAIGLLITIPLYYILRIKGIVPGIIVTSIISLIISYFFARRISIKPVNVSYIRTFAESKGMLSMGFFINLSGLISLGASYVVRIYISHQGDVSQVGLYNAGFAIINTYVGLIFTAMATDYYPRLSAVSYSNDLTKSTINQQAEIAILILAPILIVFLVFIKWVVILLYSYKFIAIDSMIYWAALGMFFKTATWAVGFILLAKGVSRIFFINELIGNVYILGMNLLGYYFMGLTGLGISFLVAYFIYFIQIYFVAKIKFAFEYDSSFIRIFSFQFVLALLSFLIVNYTNKPNNYIFGIILILISSWFSLKELDKRIGIKILILSSFEKLKRRN